MSEFECYKNFSAPKWDALPDIELYMDQVVSLISKHLAVFSLSEDEIITSSMINNYVKQKLVPPPIKKRYDKTRIAFFMIICILKRVLSISAIKILLTELQKTMSAQEIYSMFCAELEFAVSRTASGKAMQPPEDFSACGAMNSAVISFANIMIAESIIKQIAFNPGKEE